MIKSISNNKKPILNNPFDANDFIYVSDIAKYFLKAIQNTWPTGVFNLGNGKSITILKILKIVEQENKSKNFYYKEYLKNKNSFSKKINFWANMKRTNKFIRINNTTTIKKGISKLINEN